MSGLWRADSASVARGVRASGGVEWMLWPLSSARHLPWWAAKPEKRFIQHGKWSCALLQRRGFPDSS